jgi:omega-6 fatty acid desaturase (delta-12 desaturase)
MACLTPKGGWLFHVRHQSDADVTGAWPGMEASLVEALTTTCREFSAFTANIGVHHAHHLCSRIPYYRLQKKLRDYPDFLSTLDKLKSEFCPALECAV